MDLKRFVEEFYDSNKSYKAILYVCLEGGADGRGFGLGASLGAIANDFAIMTVNSDCFCFYILRNTLLRYPEPSDILYKMTLPYEAIIKLKVGKFFIWNNLKIRFIDNNRSRKIKVVISDKSTGIENQKENVEVLLNFIELMSLRK